jgi:hypothetical protein
MCRYFYKDVAHRVVDKMRPVEGGKVFGNHFVGPVTPRNIHGVQFVDEPLREKAFCFSKSK